MDKLALSEEKRKYFKSSTDLFRAVLLNSHDYAVWRFQKNLRKAERYKQSTRLLGKILYIFYHRRKNIIGRKLGFDIPEGCFGPGLRIYHISPIVVNPAARIGRNCIVVGNLCIGNVKGQAIAPQIGDNCMFGWGTTVIGNITIANNCNIAAGAVVIKSVINDNETVGGVPARKIGKSEK